MVNLVIKLLKWEKEFKTKFDCDFSGKDGISLCYTFWTRWEKGICSVTNLSFYYIKPGTISVKKKSALNLNVYRKRARVKLRAIFYLEPVIEINFLERLVRNMCVEYKNACCVLINSTVYLVRQKRPFSGFLKRFKFF